MGVKRCPHMLTNATGAPTTDRCSDRIMVAGVGDCGGCKKAFCARHRLPEDHQCPNLATLRSGLKDRNTAQLIQQSTPEVKMVS